MKVCSTCKIEKRESKFYKAKDKKDGLQASCKECTKAKSNKWKADHPDRNLAEQIKQYGLTVEQYKQLLEKQNGSCAICQLPQSQIKRRFAVDHCHNTNKIRGLLCYHCNLMLGHSKDNPSTLLKAATYLT